MALNTPISTLSTKKEDSKETIDQKIWNLQYVYTNPRVTGEAPTSQTASIRIA